MRIKLLLSFGVIAMAAAIAYGFIIGDLIGEARELVHYPWFHVSMIDLYVGFALFASWIAFRERHLRTALIWIVLLMVLGNLLSCAYALWAIAQARGDMQRFWMGHRAEMPTRA